MTVGKKLRFEVFKRDSFTCQYCGKSAPDVILHADHIHPKSKGGLDDITNLVTSCADCNLGKGARELSDDSVIKKQQAQLEQLQERREQIEMMMSWQRGLMDLDQKSMEEIQWLWLDLSHGVLFQELDGKGEKTIRKLLKQ